MPATLSNYLHEPCWHWCQMLSEGSWCVEVCAAQDQVRLYSTMEVIAISVRMSWSAALDAARQEVKDQHRQVAHGTIVTSERKPGTAKESRIRMHAAGWGSRPSVNSFGLVPPQNAAGSRKDDLLTRPHSSVTAARPELSESPQIAPNLELLK